MKVKSSSKRFFNLMLSSHLGVASTKSPLSFFTWKSPVSLNLLIRPSSLKELRWSAYLIPKPAQTHMIGNEDHTENRSLVFLVIDSKEGSSARLYKAVEIPYFLSLGNEF